MGVRQCGIYAILQDEVRRPHCPTPTIPSPTPLPIMVKEAATDGAGYGTNSFAFPTLYVNRELEIRN